MSHAFLMLHSTAWTAAGLALLWPSTLLPLILAPGGAEAQLLTRALTALSPLLAGVLILVGGLLCTGASSKFLKCVGRGLAGCQPPARHIHVSPTTHARAARFAPPTSPPHHPRTAQERLGGLPRAGAGVRVRGAPRQRRARFSPVPPSRAISVHGCGGGAGGIACLRGGEGGAQQEGVIARRTGDAEAGVGMGGRGSTEEVALL